MTWELRLSDAPGIPGYAVEAADAGEAALRFLEDLGYLVVGTADDNDNQKEN